MANPRSTSGDTLHPRPAISMPQRHTVCPPNRLDVHMYSRSSSPGGRFGILTSTSRATVALKAKAKSSSNPPAGQAVQIDHDAYLLYTYDADDSTSQHSPDVDGSRSRSGLTACHGHGHGQPPASTLLQLQTPAASNPTRAPHLSMR
ncbi:hypothetical protein EVG20_g1460 [Dentipellis fragilis]|uniref:Uncharacterized protein n=1 Tax=Dentipellis fragilis TaxID=205917 RepID=A0A4Y9ZCQ8_9AGAM|nr:hypothetical protein EVG20_g1460 [Dentipellis fragilis]